MEYDIVIWCEQLGDFPKEHRELCRLNTCCVFADFYSITPPTLFSYTQCIFTVAKTNNENERQIIFLKVKMLSFL